MADTGSHGADIAAQRIDDLDRACLFACTSPHQSVYALDLGCGSGAHTLRMLQAGAHVTALDIGDYAATFQKYSDEFPGAVQFIRADISNLDVLNLSPLNIVYSQRTLHYLPFEEALRVLRLCAKLSQRSVRFYLSASGLSSELATDYPHLRVRVLSRFANLAAAMAEKHGMHSPVCLYSQEDFTYLLMEAGLRPLRVWTSPFGNVKAIAELCS